MVLSGSVKKCESKKAFDKFFGELREVSKQHVVASRGNIAQSFKRQIGSSSLERKEAPE